MKVLTVCGSPRKGNSEAIAERLQAIFWKLGVENEVLLLRQKNIIRCHGCVESCNKNLKCQHTDDMGAMLEAMKTADGYVLVSPTYFGMPPGLMKDFIDKASVLYTEKAATGKPELSKKRAIVIAVGTDKPLIKQTLNNLSKNFLGCLDIKTVAEHGFVTKSELAAYDELFKRDKSASKTLEKLAKKLVKALKSR